MSDSKVIECVNELKNVKTTELKKVDDILSQYIGINYQPLPPLP